MSNSIKHINPPIEDLETNLIYNLLRMVDILTIEVEESFKRTGGRFSKQKKANYKRYITLQEQAIKWFEKNIEDDYWEGANHQPKKFDQMRGEANELLQLILLYIDRQASSPEAHYQIFKYIRSLPSLGFVKEEDLESFQKIKL